MDFFIQFDRFDPMTGDAPDAPFGLLPTIVARARKLLASRSRKQIVSAAQTADWLIDEYNSARGDGNHATGSAVDALKGCIGDYVLGDDPDFPNGREFEYFAVLALWKVADAIHQLQTPTDDGHPIRYEFRCSVAGSDALEAMDAVCWAEHLSFTEALQEERDSFAKEVRRRAHPAYFHAKAMEIADGIVKERVSLLASKAAIKRHSENHAMKAQVFEWCDENMSSFSGSLDDAAFRIAGYLVPAKFRTVREWITDWRKQRPARTP
jgi:hypothetical protein